jgi:hypothetical protein
LFATAATLAIALARTVPESPGAVLMLNVETMDSARSITDALPLSAAGLVEVELTELHPMEL